MIWAFVWWIPMMLVVVFSFKKDLKQQVIEYAWVALELFLGFFALETTDIQQVALVDEEFAEFLVESPFLYYILRLTGWAEIASAAAIGVRAIVMKVKPVEQPPVPQYGVPVYPAPQHSAPAYRSAPAPVQQPGPAPAAVEVKLPSGMVMCPKCQTAQRSDRTVCYECGEPLKQ